MRIIEEKHNHEKKIVCSHCGSTLAWTGADIYSHQKDPWTFMSHTSQGFWYIRKIWHCIKCPVCGWILRAFSTEENKYLDHIMENKNED